MATNSDSDNEYGQVGVTGGQVSSDTCDIPENHHEEASLSLHGLFHPPPLPVI